MGKTKKILFERRLHTCLLLTCQAHSHFYFLVCDALYNLYIFTHYTEYTTYEHTFTHMCTKFSLFLLFARICIYRYDIYYSHSFACVYFVHCVPYKFIYETARRILVVKFKYTHIHTDILSIGTQTYTETATNTEINKDAATSTLARIHLQLACVCFIITTYCRYILLHMQCIYINISAT